MARRLLKPNKSTVKFVVPSTAELNPTKLQKGGEFYQRHLLEIEDDPNAAYLRIVKNVEHFYNQFRTETYNSAMFDAAMNYFRGNFTEKEIVDAAPAFASMLYNVTRRVTMMDNTITPFPKEHYKFAKSVMKELLANSDSMPARVLEKLEWTVDGVVFDPNEFGMYVKILDNELQQIKDDYGEETNEPKESNIVFNDALDYWKRYKGDRNPTDFLDTFHGLEYLTKQTTLQAGYAHPKKLEDHARQMIDALQLSKVYSRHVYGYVKLVEWGRRPYM